MKLKSALYEELERTLSYFEKMSLEMIYIDLDPEFLKQNPTLTIEDLSQSLIKMKKDGIIKIEKIDNHNYYLKIYPKKSFINKIRTYFTR